MKIVINKCYGGFGLSHEAVMEYARLKGMKIYAYTKKNMYSGRYKPYEGKGNSFMVYYTLKPNIFDNENYFSENDIPRDDKDLVKVVEKLGEGANGQHAKLDIVEILDDIEWEIEEYDGVEWIAEKHRTWG